jgi:acetylornithine deacetylase/succinyl-diaminopimelate desuccinylase-like protein
LSASDCGRQSRQTNTAAATIDSTIVVFIVATKAGLVPESRRMELNTRTGPGKSRRDIGHEVWLNRRQLRLAPLRLRLQAFNTQLPNPRPETRRFTARAGSTPSVRCR